MNDITDIEREKMKEFDSLRGSSLEKFYGCTDRNKPSLVLDDFLFLGNMESGTNQELLERFQISKFFRINFHILISFLLEHILNVCDFDTDQKIQDNFNVIHIPMSDDPDTNIKQV
jgi:hypothetical protein